MPRGLPDHQGAQRSPATRPRRLRRPAHRSRRPRRSRRHRGCPPTTTTDRCHSALGRRLADHPHQLQIEPNRPDHTDQKTHRTRERAPHSATRHRSPTPPRPKPLPTNTTRYQTEPTPITTEKSTQARQSPWLSAGGRSLPTSSRSGRCRIGRRICVPVWPVPKWATRNRLVVQACAPRPSRSGLAG